MSEADDFEQSIARLRNLQKPNQQDQALALLIEKWVTADPLQAASYAQAQPEAAYREKLLRSVLQAWAIRDSNASLSWSEHLIDPVDRQNAASWICMKLAERSPPQAIQTAIHYHLDRSTNGLLENMTAQWAERDPSKAYNWARQQAPGDLRDALMERVMFVWSQTNPAAAAGIVVSEMEPGPEQNEAAMSVLHQWALKDFNGAASWVQAFPEGALRDRAMAELEGIKKLPRIGDVVQTGRGAEGSVDDFRK
ncbi:MAG: hypothetical protein ABIT76_14150 [Chthoniobacterales bacterium]